MKDVLLVKTDEKTFIGRPLVEGASGDLSADDLRKLRIYSRRIRSFSEGAQREIDTLKGERETLALAVCLVDVCVPNFMHRDVVIAAAEAGKHILVEKPPHWPASERWANGGVYLLGPRIWAFAPGAGYHDFGFDLLPAMLAAGARVQGFRCTRSLIDIGSHERLEQATAAVEQGRLPRPQAVLPC